VAETSSPNRGPYVLVRPGLYSKADFLLNLRRQTVTCPAGHVEIFELGTTVHFDPDVYGPCPRREHCTHPASGSGRSLSIAEDEDAEHVGERLGVSGRS
jgi:hypothetical protein